MRVEDIDPPRVVPGSAAAILEDLAWLGLDWDQAPDGATHWVQSERSAYYREALATLGAQGLIYGCTCTRRELQSLSSAPHQGEEAPRYPGFCRDKGLPLDAPRTAWRLRTGAVMPAFDDLLYGPHAAYEGPDDFVLRRSDGLFAYQLAVVLDDIAMDVTEVVRGCDLLSSVPRQLALYEALGAARPSYLHLPLMLGEDGQRLSKRHAGTTIRAQRALGRTREEVIGALAASLGLIDAAKALSLSDLRERFQVSALRI